MRAERGESKAQERFDAFRSIATVIRVRFDRVADRPLLEEGSPRDAEEENGRQARWREMRGSET